MAIRPTRPQAAARCVAGRCLGSLRRDRRPPPAPFSTLKRLFGDISIRAWDTYSGRILGRKSTARRRMAVGRMAMGRMAIRPTLAGMLSSRNSAPNGGEYRWQQHARLKPGPQTGTSNGHRNRPLALHLRVTIPVIKSVPA